MKNSVSMHPAIRHSVNKVCEVNKVTGEQFGLL
jgi:hypothetical protein